MILNPHHNRILLRQGDVPKDHEKHPILLLNQNTTLEISNKFNPVWHLFHGPGISHANGFSHWSTLFNIHVSPIQLSTYATILPTTSCHRFGADARPARVFQCGNIDIPVLL
jgi:hypothetical protein